MEPQKPPRSKFKSWQMGFFWRKNIVKGRGIGEGWNNTWGTRLSTTACSSIEVTSARYPPLSKSFYRISTPAKHFESNILVPISDAYKPHYHINRPWHFHQYNPQTLSGNSRGPDSSSSEEWTHGSNMGLSGKQNLRLCESYFPERHFLHIIGCIKSYS